MDNTNSCILKSLISGKLRFREFSTMIGLRSSIHGRKYFVSDKLKVVYIPVSKSGNSSIKKMLLRAEGIDESELTHPDKPYFIHSNKNIKCYTHNRWKKKWDNYFIFSVVRNPVDRYLSSHYNKFLDKKKIELRGFEFKRHLGGLLTPDLDALELLKIIAPLSDKLINEHFCPQSFWIYKHHKCHPKIFKLEQIDKLIDTLKNKGIKIEKIEHENRSFQREKEPISEELLSLIKFRYRKDFEIFGYK